MSTRSSRARPCPRRPVHHGVEASYIDAIEPTLLPLHDAARGRRLPTFVHLPADGPDAPLIVFCHGFAGHPRMFARLFARWVAAGFVVAAPAFPLTNDESPPPLVIDDVVNHPADVSFVLDELLARGLGDDERVGVGGYSIGAETTLAVGLHPTYADMRVRAVVAVAGGLGPAFATDVLRPLPLLVVHGSEERERRVVEIRAAYEAAHEPKELVVVAGAGHRLVQDADEPHAERVAELTTAFWERRLLRQT